MLITSLPSKIQWSLCTATKAPSFIRENCTVIHPVSPSPCARHCAGAKSDSGVEMRDKDTIEIALEAAETGHLVMSTLHTIDASKTVERIVGVFPLAGQFIIRNRVAKSFRYIVSQRLI